MSEMNRRAFINLGLGAIGASMIADLSTYPRVLAAKSPFKYSICNEMFEKWDFARVCKTIKAVGYEGIEIAPFTLAESVDEISQNRRKELRDIMQTEGIEFAGLHWLLVSPKWLHITTADRDVRARSWDYFKKLIDFCADLGRGGIMVLGSPKQRGTRGNTVEEATKNLKDGLAAMAPYAQKRGVTVALEPLDKTQTDVVNTLDEAVKIVKEINNPAIQTMFDFHNTLDEREPLDGLVRKYFKMIRHIHINEMDGRHPGTGKFDFKPVLQALKDMKYSGWVSLEVFDFTPGPERIAREAFQYMKKIESELK